MAGKGGLESLVRFVGRNHRISVKGKKNKKNGEDMREGRACGLGRIKVESG